MAAAKKRTTTLLDVLSALAPPADAYGLARAKGLGANPAAEAFLGCGFPRFVIGVDSAATAPEVAAFTKRYPHGTVPGVMPRQDIATLYRLRTTGLSPAEQEAALRDDVALGLTVEAMDLLFSTGLGGSLPLWLLEAELGAEVVLDAVINFMTSREPDAWIHGVGAPALVRALGTTLYRVRAAAHAQYVHALETIVTRIDPRSKAAKSLDVILHGRKGVERNGNGIGGRLFLAEYAWAGDDPAWVVACVLARLEALRPADREIFDPQVVVAGGAPLIDAFRTSPGKFQVTFRKDMTTYATLFR